MAVVLEHRDMNSSTRLTTTPALAEFIFDTDVRKIFAGDGVTIGGVPADGALTTGNNTASYSILSTDAGKLFVFTYNSGTIAVALAQAASSGGAYLPDGSFVIVSNQSASKVLTITAATSTINGASTLVLHPGDSAKIISDGTNYWAIKCVTDLAGLSDVSITSPANGDGIFYNSGTGKWTNGPVSGGGLYSSVIGSVPTSVGTGLSTWLNQGGASVANVATGIAITTPGNASDSIRGRYGAVPSTPYNRRFLLSLNSIVLEGVNVSVGWYDGSNKLQFIGFDYDGSGNPGVVGIMVISFSTPTAFSAVNFNGAGKVPNISLPLWFHLADDGTNVSFGWSMDGIYANAAIVYSVAKASGYLGATGYSNLIFMTNSHASNAFVGTMQGFG